MEVSPTGQNPVPAATSENDPIALLSILVNLQSQVVEMQKQLVELQRQHLELTREMVHVSREQRSRQAAEIERWQQSHSTMIEACKPSLAKLEAVHASLMQELTQHIDENHENLLEGDFALSDFVDRFGPRLAHLNTMLAVLRPLSLSLKKSD